MNKLFLVVAIILVGVLGYWYFNQPAEMIEESAVVVEDDTNEAIQDEVSDEVEVLDDVDTEVISVSATGRVFIVDGEENPTLTVGVGNTVRIDFAVTGGMHDFVIDELGVASEVLSVGESEMIEFVATEAGTFEYYCSVGNHYAEGMFGTIIVE